MPLDQHLTIPSFLEAASGFSLKKPTFMHWQSLRFERVSKVGTQSTFPQSKLPFLIGSGVDT